MERSGGSEPFRDSTFPELIDWLVEDGKGIVLVQQKPGPKQTGYLEGLDLCSEMRDLDLEAFKEALDQRLEEDNEYRRKSRAGEISSDDYWQHRCATTEIEQCYEVLRVAYFAKYGEYPNDKGWLSAQAIARYQAQAILRQPLVDISLN